MLIGLGMILSAYVDNGVKIYRGELVSKDIDRFKYNDGTYGDPTYYFTMKYPFTRKGEAVTNKFSVSKQLYDSAEIGYKMNFEHDVCDIENVTICLRYIIGGIIMTIFGIIAAIRYAED